MADELIHVVVCGVGGTMGAQEKELIEKDPKLVFAGGVEREDHPLLAADSFPDFLVRGSLAEVLDELEGELEPERYANLVVVSFVNSADVAAEHAQVCKKYKKAYICGTTGLKKAHKKILAECAKTIQIVYAPNMSFLANLTLTLVRLAVRILQFRVRIGIFEAHHNNKKDAPSGTAVQLGEIACEERSQQYDKAVVVGRQGDDCAPDDGDIDIAVHRAGDYVGKHVVTFYGVGEILEISHFSYRRNDYIRGALEAARQILGMPPGLYDMDDIYSFGDYLDPKMVGK